MNDCCSNLKGSTGRKPPLQCRFVHHKSHTDLPGMKLRPPRWQAGDWPPESWHIFGKNATNSVMVRQNSQFKSQILRYFTHNLYLFTYSLHPAHRFSASQEIPRILSSPKDHYHIYKCLPPVSILSQLDPVCSPTSHWRSILIFSSLLCLGLPSSLFPSGFPTKTLYAALLSKHNLLLLKNHNEITITIIDNNRDRRVLNSTLGQ